MTTPVLVRLGATFVFVLCVAPVVGEFFVELARQQGAYDDPEQAVGVVTAFLVKISSQPWYPYLLGASFGLILGISIEKVAKKLDSGSKGESYGLSIVSLDLAQVKRSVDAFNTSLKENPRIRSSVPQFLSLDEVANIRSTFASLGRFGIASPIVPERVGREVGLIVGDYLATIYPFVARNQKTEARREAKRFVSAIVEKK